MATVTTDKKPISCDNGDRGKSQLMATVTTEKKPISGDNGDSGKSSKRADSIQNCELYYFIYLDNSSNYLGC